MHNKEQWIAVTVNDGEIEKITHTSVWVILRSDEGRAATLGVLASAPKGVK